MQRHFDVEKAENKLGIRNDPLSTNAITDANEKSKIRMFPWKSFPSFANLCHILNNVCRVSIRVYEENSVFFFWKDIGTKLRMKCLKKTQMHLIVNLG